MFTSLVKAAIAGQERSGHKYVRRRPDGRGGWEYEYAKSVSPAQGALDFDKPAPTARRAPLTDIAEVEGLTLHEVEARIRNDKIEHAVTFGKDGGQVLRKTGTEREVGFTAAESAAIFADGAAVFTHSHPSAGYPLSATDVCAAITLNCAEIRAVGAVGDAWTVKRPAEGWGATTRSGEHVSFAEPCEWWVKAAWSKHREGHVPREVQTATTIAGSDAKAAWLAVEKHLDLLDPSPELDAYRQAFAAQEAAREEAKAGKVPWTHVSDLNYALSQARLKLWSPIYGYCIARRYNEAFAAKGYNFRIEHEPDTAGRELGSRPGLAARAAANQEVFGEYVRHLYRRANFRKQVGAYRKHVAELEAENRKDPKRSVWIGDTVFRVLGQGDTGRDGTVAEALELSRPVLAKLEAADAKGEVIDATLHESPMATYVDESDIWNTRVREKTNLFYRPAAIKGMLAHLGVSGMFMELVKAAVAKGRERAGHKYLRREPDGKGGWRYFYTEAAHARDVKEGVEVTLRHATPEEAAHVAKIRKVDKEGLDVEIQGKVERLSHDDWRKLLHKYHGDKFMDWADQRARRVANAVLRHVPRAMLADLQGETDAERFADLRARAPAVYDKLAASFARAGMTPESAREAVHFLLSRRGWAADARGCLLGNLLDSKRAWLVSHWRQTARAAENLASRAGSATVEARHVQAAVELRQPKPGHKDDFARTFAEDAAKAAGETAKLTAMLDAARESGDPADAAKALQEALKSPMLAKLVALSTAFPALAGDKTVQAAHDVMLEVPSVSLRKTATRDGAETHLFVPGEDGRPKTLPARYRLVEAAELIASHDPVSFGRNPRYPEGWQERAYHRDKAEQAKVVNNANAMNSALFVNTNPDAVNGPPIVTQDGVVLGGNSRAMSLSRAYADGESGERYKAYLAANAHQVGLRKEDVEALKAPVLVREMDVGGQDPKLLVRQLNESFTQAMDPRTMQVALGRKLPDDVLAGLGAAMAEDETLSKFLDGSRADRFVGALRTAGLIDRRNENQYTIKGRPNRLNEDGKTLVERVLVGKMLDDPDMLSDTKSSIVSSLARAVPYMVQAEGAGAGYSVREDVKTAVRAYNELNRMGDILPQAGAKNIEAKTNEAVQQLHDMWAGEHPVSKSARARALLDVLVQRPGPVQMAAVFREYAKHAKLNPEGQSGMFGESEAPADVFKRVLRTTDEKPKESKEPEAAKAPASDAGLFAGVVRGLTPRWRGLQAGVR